MKRFVDIVVLKLLSLHGFHWYYESACHASVTFPFQTEDQSSEDMDSLDDDDSVVDNADTNINVSTNPCNRLLLIYSHFFHLSQFSIFNTIILAAGWFFSFLFFSKCLSHIAPHSFVIHCYLLCQWAISSFNYTKRIVLHQNF